MESRISTNAAAVGNGAKKVLVRAFVWYQTRTSCRIPVKVSIGTEAGGGNYASMAFVHSVEHSGRGGQSTISLRGTGVAVSGRSH